MRKKVNKNSIPEKFKPHKTLIDITLQHIDTFQRSANNTKLTTSSPSKNMNKKNSNIRKTRISRKISPKDLCIQTAEIATHALRNELVSHITTNHMSDVVTIHNNNDQKTGVFQERTKDDISSAIITAFDSSLASFVSSCDEITTASELRNAPIRNSVYNVLDFIASFTCLQGDGTLTISLLERAAMFNSVKYESIRLIICDFLGLCIKYLNSSGLFCSWYKNSRQKELALRSKVQKKQSGNALPFLMGSIEENDDKLWRRKCMIMIKKCLVPRLEDKSKDVRNAALKSCGCFFTHENKRNNSIERDVDVYVYELQDHDSDESINELEILNAMIHNLRHDSSSEIRSTAILNIPITSQILQLVIERVRDTKVSVRINALKVLKEKIDVRQLTEIQRAEVLISGLTKRCTLTYAETARMLCCGWMKTMKFQPVDTIRLLDPVINEIASERAAYVIISAAFDDNFDQDETGICFVSSRITLRDLSENEVRAYKEEVFNNPVMLGTIVGFNFTNEEDINNKIQNEDETIDPATILYLRILCDSISKLKSISQNQKAQRLSKILPDIPVIGELLQKHVLLLSNSVHSLNENTVCEEEHVLNEEKQVLRSVGDNRDDADQREDEENFICLQLLKLVLMADLREEGSRRSFAFILRGILSSLRTHSDIIEACVKALAMTSIDYEHDFLKTISDILINVNDTNQMVGTTSITSSIVDTIEATKDNAFLPYVHELDKGLIAKKCIRSIEILSFALENVASKGMRSPILYNFEYYILPAITDMQYGPGAREIGVSCLGRYAFLMDEQIVMNKYRILLMEVASSKDERIEIRAQALMAITDLSFRFQKMLSPVLLKSSFDGTDTCLVDLICGILLNSQTVLAVVSGECVAKLHLLGRVHNAVLVAHLVVMFFDKRFCSINEIHVEDVGEVGSSVRLQQLLSLFFPTYAIKSSKGREILKASVKPMLVLIFDRMSKKVTGKRLTSWPIAKMIEFLCSCVDKGEEKDFGNNEGSESTSNDEESSLINKDSALKNISSVLSMIISLSSYIIEKHASLSCGDLRNLCKILGSTFIDVKVEDVSALRQLQRNVDDISMLVTDNISIVALRAIHECLSGIPSEEEDNRKNTNAECRDVDNNKTENFSIVNELNSKSKSLDKSCGKTLTESYKLVNSNDPLNQEKVIVDYVDINEEEFDNDETIPRFSFSVTSKSSPKIQNRVRKRLSVYQNNGSNDSLSLSEDGDIPTFATLGSSRESQSTSFINEYNNPKDKKIINKNTKRDSSSSYRSNSRLSLETIDNDEDNIPLFASIAASRAHKWNLQKASNRRRGVLVHSENDDSENDLFDDIDNCVM